MFFFFFYICMYIALSHSLRWVRWAVVDAPSFSFFLFDFFALPPPPPSRFSIIIVLLSEQFAMMIFQCALHCILVLYTGAHHCRIHCTCAHDITIDCSHCCESVCVSLWMSMRSSCNSFKNTLWKFNTKHTDNDGTKSDSSECYSAHGLSNHCVCVCACACCVFALWRSEI